MEGNKRFVEDSPAAWSRTDARQQTLGGQKPIAAVIICSDSRVSPEIIFDQPIGSLFVIRNAGAILNNNTKQSILFAVHQLKINVIVVVGHEKCGVVSMVAKKYMPVVTVTQGQVFKALRELEGDEENDSEEIEDKLHFVDRTVKCHAQRSAALIALLFHPDRRPKIVPLYYSLSSGRVTELKPFKGNPSQQQQAKRRWWPF